MVGQAVKVYLVWEPILITDRALPPQELIQPVGDQRIEQLWDANHLLSAELQRRLAADSEHPRPMCCDKKGTLWDLVAVYPIGAKWEQTLPRAAYMSGPVAKVNDDLRQVVVQLVGSSPSLRSSSSHLRYGQLEDRATSSLSWLQRTPRTPAGVRLLFSSVTPGCREAKSASLYPGLISRHASGVAPHAPQEALIQ